MIWERGAGRVGRGHCGRCFTPHGCARPTDHDDPCPCHVPRGVICRFSGCDAGLFVAIPRDLDVAIAKTRAAQTDGEQKDAA